MLWTVTFLFLFPKKFRGAFYHAGSNPHHAPLLLFLDPRASARPPFCNFYMRSIFLPLFRQSRRTDHFLLSQLPFFSRDCSDILALLFLWQSPFFIISSWLWSDIRCPLPSALPRFSFLPLSFFFFSRQNVRFPL